MKVRELIEELSKLNPEFDVIMQKDGEGNSYSPCAGVDITHYMPETTWSGEVSDETPDKNAAVLYPVN